MDTTAIHKIIEQGLAEKFWSDLNEDSAYHVEFIDAAVCFAALRELSFHQYTSRAAQA